MKEKVVKDRVKRTLKKYNVYWFMPVQMGYGAPALDFYCCYKKLFLAIETKVPGKKLTARQSITKEIIENAGGKVFVIDGDTMELEKWLKAH